MHRRFVPLAFAVFGAATLLAPASAARADLLVSSQDTNTIFRFDENTGASLGTLIGPAAGLSGPVGMRVGPDGALYIGNQFNGTISRYDFSTQALTTFATGPGGFGAADVQFLPDGDLLVSNFFGGSVVRFDGTTGAYEGSFTSGGSLAQPTNMLFDGGLLYVSSLSTNNVQRFDATTGAYVDDFVGAGSGGLSFPAGLAFDSGHNLLVSSLNGQQILKYDGTTGASLGVYLNTPAFSFPSDLLFHNGDLLISTTGSQGVLKWDGTNLTTFASAVGLQIAGQMVIAQVPEASSLLLGAGGLAGFFAARRMTSRKRID